LNRPLRFEEQLILNSKVKNSSISLLIYTNKFHKQNLITMKNDKLCCIMCNFIQ
jgi:hypothetical protein